MVDSSPKYILLFAATRQSTWVWVGRSPVQAPALLAGPPGLQYFNANFIGYRYSIFLFTTCETANFFRLWYASWYCNIYLSSLELRIRSDPILIRVRWHKSCLIFVNLYQGSGSAWIRINLSFWIRIRIQIADPDPRGQKWLTQIEKSPEFSCFKYWMFSFEAWRLLL